MNRKVLGQLAWDTGAVGSSYTRFDRMGAMNCFITWGVRTLKQGPGLEGSAMEWAGRVEDSYPCCTVGNLFSNIILSV